MGLRRSAIAAIASSQLMRSNRPSPFLPVRRMRMQQAVGMVGPLRIARHLGTEHAGGRRVRRPDPVTLMATPSLTCTSSAQVSGQSCGQAAFTCVIGPCLISVMLVSTALLTAVILYLKAQSARCSLRGQVEIIRVTH